MVIIEGYAVNGSGTTSVFTLPAGYRPAARIQVPVVTGNATIDYMNILANGGVQPHSGGGNGCMLNCTFLAEQ